MSAYRATRSWLAMVRTWTCEQADLRRRQAVREARARLQLPVLPHRRRRLDGSVWCVGIAKNEADIIELTVRHLLEQGADAILVADNGSTDGTEEILHDLAREGCPIHVAVDGWPAHEQGVKTTMLAHAARRAGADWIVPFDADELWFSREATLREYLGHARATFAHARIHNAFPLDDTPLRSGTRLRVDTTVHKLPKVALRSHVLASIADGNHHTNRSGPRDDGLRILHVPWRSLPQLRRKAQQGSVANRQTRAWRTQNTHWQNLATLPDDEVDERWRRILAGEPSQDIGWSPIGPFVVASPLRWKTWDPDGLLRQHRR